MWSLVIFPKSSLEQESVSLVPSSWVLKSKVECYWPPGPASKLIKTLSKPQANWIKVQCRVKNDKILSYADGRKLEQEAEHFTNPETLCSETEKNGTFSKFKPTRQRHATRGVPSHKLGLVSVSPTNSGSSSDDSNSSSDPIESYSPLMTSADIQDLEVDRQHHGHQLAKLPRTTTTIVSNSQPQSGTPKRPLADLPGTSARTLHSSLSQPSETSGLSLEQKVDLLLARQTSLEQTVSKALAGIKVGINQLLSQFNHSNSAVQTSALDLFPVPLPLESIHHFDQLEAWAAANSTNYNILVSFCSSFGGKSSGKISRIILSQLFTAHVARQINWTGRNQKSSLVGKKIKDAVVEATKSNQKLTEEERKVSIIEENIKNWFRNSRDLEGGKSSRKNDISSRSTTGNPERNKSVAAIASQSAHVSFKWDPTTDREQSE